MKQLIIYHGNCYDGFTAAWVARRALWNNGLDAELFPAKYGEPPPPVMGRVVYVLDFSYPREVMEKMHAEAAFLLVLDHHKTAAEACAGLPFCVFDMERSGCRMAWDYFEPGTPPDWILRIEDRDLWRFKYGDTKEVHAYVAAQPMTEESWDRIAQTPIAAIAAGGKAIREYIDTYCAKAAQEARVAYVGGHRAVVVNVPYQNASEMADVLLRDYEHVAFSAGYFQRADRRWQFSLRSRGGFDVSYIAKKFGGGGHLAAAGFDVGTLDDALEDTIP